MCRLVNRAKSWMAVSTCAANSRVGSSTRRAGLLLMLAQEREYRQGESGRFARAGLGAADDIDARP